jgi:dinuclear metal center YbgI/SA1388 family protein
MMKLKEICSYLDSAIPLSFQEGYDNSGLQLGLPEMEVNSALLTLDITEKVLDEAGYKGCNIIISHHPLIFSGLKRISGRSFTERILLKAVKQDIAIYSAHTNLDALNNGVSRKMAEKIGLKNVRVLSPLKNKLLKLVTFVPDNYLDKVKETVFGAGAGVTGGYDNCGFYAQGTGSFRGNETTNPFVGEKGKVHSEKETRFETVFYSHMKEKVIKALVEAHPYEEPVYDIYLLENENIETGIGCTGELNEPMNEMEFLKLISEVFTVRCLKYSVPTGKKVKKAALCGGAGGLFINDAISAGADAYVTSDIRYHSYFETENQILLADIGHYESEIFSTEILHDLILKKFPNFAVRFSEVNTNPINYL